MRIAAQQAPPTRSVQPVMRGVSLPMASQQREYAGNQAALRRLSPIAPRLQPRLAIGSVSDPLEAEADRAADQVMRSPIPSQPLVQRKCSSCEEEDETLQRKQDGPVMDAIDAPPIVHRALAAPGRPLDRETRDFFEQRYAQDFSQVRIHADAVAADSAASIRAHAYTAGRHIAFAHDRYQPHTPAGRHLLAHELAHVVQQGGGGVAAVRRLGDVTQVPLTLPCPVAASNAPQAQDFLLFPNNSSTLSDAQKNQLAAFANRWSTDGGGATIRIDGFASEPGGQPQNWQLSCDRAGAVKDALVNPPIPQVGIPESSINLFMQGETAEFGADALNRRVTLSFPAPAPVAPAPVPTTPEQPTAPTVPTVPTAGASTSDCKADEAALITSAVSTAKSNIAAVVPQLAPNPLSADIQNALWLYFRDSSAATASTVSTNLKKIASNLDSVTYECEEDCAENLLGYTRYGTVITGLGNIHLCMNNLKPDADTIANTILHETAHYALQAGDSVGYYGNDCEESDATLTADSATRLNLADSYNCFVKNWVTSSATDRANAKGDLTGANIAGIEQGPAGPIDLSASRRKPLFSIRLNRGPLAQVTGVSYRWIFSDAQDRSYRMTDTSGNDLFDFKPASESVLAIFNTPTRELLKQRGVTSGTVVCRANSPIFQDKVFKLPVTFLSAAP